MMKRTEIGDLLVIDDVNCFIESFWDGEGQVEPEDAITLVAKGEDGKWYTMLLTDLVARYMQ